MRHRSKNNIWESTSHIYKKTWSTCTVATVFFSCWLGGIFSLNKKITSLGNNSWNRTDFGNESTHLSFLAGSVCLWVKAQNIIFDWEFKTYVSTWVCSSVLLKLMHFKGNCPWSLLVRAKESPHSLLMYSDKRQTWIRIPRHSQQDSETNATQDGLLADRRGWASRLMVRWSSIMTNSAWSFSDSAADCHDSMKSPGGSGWP